MVKPVISKEPFKYPDVWEDDTRMNALYAPFRQKSINPIDWESKLKFWESLIQDYCIHFDQPTISLSSLKTTFLRKGKIPACLNTVFDELIRKKYIVPIEKHFNSFYYSDTYLTWAIRNLVKNPLLWTVSKITGPFSAKQDMETARFVHLPTVQVLADEFIKRLPESFKGRLIEMQELITKNLIEDEETFKIMLNFLMEANIATVTGEPHLLLVKFRKNDEKYVVVSELDRGIYQLANKGRLLQKNIESLEAEKEDAHNEVRRCLKAGRKQMAKSWLRRQHELEKYIDKRTSALENIRTLLDKLQQTESDNLVLQAYREGIAALKNTFKTTGLTEEQVDATMDELSDVLDVHNDIEESLSRSLDNTADLQLEEELDELLQSDTMPSIPPDDPSNSSKIDLPDIPNEDAHDSLEERLKALLV